MVYSLSKNDLKYIRYIKFSALSLFKENVVSYCNN